MNAFDRRGFLLGAGALAAVSGCDWLDKFKTPFGPKRPDAALEAKEAREFVRFVNEQASVLDAVSFEDVSMTVDLGGAIDPDLSATIDCAKPRSFRMKCNHALQSGQVDVGSNDRDLWIYVRQVAKGQPNFVFTSHDDLSSGRANLPIPFDPNWVFMALGMSGIDANGNPQVDVLQRQREYKLTWDSRTPQGAPVKMVTVFAGDNQTGTSPQVRKHLVYDARSGKPIGGAEIRKVKRLEIANPRDGRRLAVELPSEISLVFQSPEGQKLRMDMTLRRERINPSFTPEQQNYLFSMPSSINGATPVNLAGGRPPGTPNARGQISRK